MKKDSSSWKFHLKETKRILSSILKHDDFKRVNYHLRYLSRNLKEAEEKGAISP